MPHAICLIALLTTGCITARQHPAATQPATAGETRSLLPAYWWEQPATVQVQARDFDRLWSACQDAVIADGFALDRLDYREGQLWTAPLISKQVFEVWRSDVADPHSLAQSNLATIRRTVRFRIRRLSNGAFQLEPKVLVERYSMIERRITSAAQYHDIFSIRLLDVDLQRERTEGPELPAAYWYAVGRDHALEKQLARSVQSKLHT